MSYKYFSCNGELLPVEQAVVPLSNIEYSYGFGVYENIRVSTGHVHFLEDHCVRLMKSAKIIGLDHNFSDSLIKQSISALIKANEAENCNLKVLLIGGKTPEEASLSILCLNPLFPDRKLYKEGAACTTYCYERAFPGAKTLNMLQSYLAYREAAERGAYDALLINREGRITEGTRTNFFAIKDRTLFTPPEKDVLPGVTRKYVIKVALENGFELREQNIQLADVAQFDGAFLTSTPSKIMPIRSIDGEVLWQAPAPDLKKLSLAFNDFLGR